MSNIKISACGKYLPKQKVRNKELEQRLNLEDGYIYKRTGIETRYYSGKEKIEDMAINAVKDLEEKSDKNLKDIRINNYYYNQYR